MQSRFKDRSTHIRKVYDDALLRELAASQVADVLTGQLAIVNVALTSVAKGKYGELPRANTVLVLDPMQETRLDEAAVHATSMRSPAQDCGSDGRFGPRLNC
jgi:hypothetical protein